MFSFEYNHIKYQVRALLVIFSIFLTLFQFTDTPKVWVDEGVFTETAKNLAYHGVLGVQVSPGEYFPMNGFLLSTSYPVIVPVASSIYAFGLGVWQARLPMVLYMLLFVLFAFLFVRKLYGEYPAVLSTLLILSFSPFFGNGRPVQGEVPGLTLMLIGAYLLLKLEERGFASPKYGLLSGLFLGLSCATKPSYLILLSTALVISAFLYRKKFKDLKTIVYLIVGLISPVILWFFMHFTSWELIKNIIPLLLYFGGTHSEQSSTLVTILLNLKRFFTESTPILFLLLTVPILFALYIRVKKIKEYISISETVILVFSLLNWVTYLNGTGWYRYFFPANLFIYLFFPALLIFIYKFNGKKIYKYLATSFVVALVMFQFYHLIFLSDTSFVVSRSRNTQLSSVLGALDPSKNVLFYNTIPATVFMKSENYSQYLSMGTFLELGNKEAINYPTFDYILTDEDQSGRVGMSCYVQKPITRFYFLERIPNCKNK